MINIWREKRLTFKNTQVDKKREKEKKKRKKKKGKENNESQEKNSTIEDSIPELSIADRFVRISRDIFEISTPRALSEQREES